MGEKRPGIPESECRRLEIRNCPEVKNQCQARYMGEQRQVDCSKWDSPINESRGSHVEAGNDSRKTSMHEESTSGSGGSPSLMTETKTNRGRLWHDDQCSSGRVTRDQRWRGSGRRWKWQRPESTVAIPLLVLRSGCLVAWPSRQFGHWPMLGESMGCHYPGGSFSVPSMKVLVTDDPSLE